jgi:hypothetical protein
MIINNNMNDSKPCPQAPWNPTSPELIPILRLASSKSAGSPCECVWENGVRPNAGVVTGQRATTIRQMKTPQNGDDYILSPEAIPIQEPRTPSTALPRHTHHHRMSEGKQALRKEARNGNVSRLPQIRFPTAFPVSFFRD